MSLMPSLLGGSGGDPGDTAQLPSNEFFTQGFEGTAYSGVQFNSNGNIYERQYGGGWSSIGAWLLNGTNSDFYLRRIIDSGTLTTDAAGTVGDLRVLSTTRNYDVQRTSNGTKLSTVTFTIVNAADSTSYANKTYTFETNRGLL